MNNSSILRDFRREKKLTQVEFASILGYGRTYIALLETNREKISHKFQISLRKKFPDWIIIDSDDFETSKPSIHNSEIAKELILLKNEILELKQMIQLLTNPNEL